MEGPHHRKIELQSTADLSYLYANTVALSRQKLDLHFPPSASNGSDPMKERVRALVDEFITKTYSSATPSISINGLDTSTSLSGKDGSSSAPLLSFLSAKEAIEYEPYDTDLAGRVTSLYAQLESLTTTVAQMRRDAPVKAAEEYAEALKGAIEEEDEGWDDESDDERVDDTNGDDVDMKNTEGESQNGQLNEQRTRTRRKSSRRKDDWKLNLDLGSEREKERWGEGEMRDVYSDALKTLVRLQGELDAEEEEDSEADGGRGLATTVGRVERARMAAEVVENM